MKKVFILIIFILSLFTIGFAEENKQEVEITTITIKNARETNYKKDEETGNDLILLEGGVELSIEKGDSDSDIQADRISYDRATEMLFAEGNVVITTKDSSSGGETTTANSLLLNTSTLEGVFDGGKVVQTKSDALNLPSGSTLIVFSDAFGKGNDNVIAFKNSSLTFCDDDNPHWHIDATRTWLLPGGEFAFFNALLYVGPVPVLYFPAFYYPKDELIFNPVFSYKKKTGYSVQTTTYLYGRKSLADSVADSSDNNSNDEEKEDDKLDSGALYNFMKPTTLKKQKLEGIVLHNLDEDYDGDTSQYLKLLLDMYSNLGIYMGIDGKFRPSKTYLTDLSFFIDLGFSNTLFKDNGEYFPFSKTGKKYKDTSTFLGVTLPFRYAANLNMTLSKPFYLSLSLPIYSDPFFASDFKNDRSESMDWISFLLDDDMKNKEDTGSGNEISSFAWKISASYNPSLPGFFKPYINSMSMSLNSSVNFSTMYTNKNTLSYEEGVIPEDGWYDNSPLRKFYYPSYIKPVQLNASISGSLFTWPLNKNEKHTQSVSFPVTLNKPDELKTEKEIEEEVKKEEQKNKEKKADSDGAQKENMEENKDPLKDFKFYLPDFSVSIPSGKELSGLTYNLNYSYSADLSTQISYASGNLKKAEDFDWKNIQSYMYTLRMPLTLSSSLNYGSSFFSMNNNFSYTPVFQKHPFISEDEENGGYSKSGADSLIFADYKAEKQDIENNNSIVFKPFTYIDLFKDTSISWKTNLKLYRKEFTGTSAENPLWENKFFDIKDDKAFTENSLSVKIASSQLENKFSQSLSFSYVMPPLLKQYNFNLNLKFPFISTSLDTGFYETTKDDVSNDEKWKKKPLSQSLSLSLFNSKLSFSESYTYNIEKKKSDNLRLSASFAGLNLAYYMSNTKGYDFNKVTGWIIRDEEEFLPNSLSISYNTPSKTFKTWNDKISLTPSLSTSIVTDLIRPTNSYFLFSPSITLNITDFLKITFSSTSRNSVLYWYFHNEPGDLYSDWGGFPGNIVKDLLNSFRFDDNTIREKSGFKLKSLKLDLEHDLHDWKLNMSLKIEPRVITENDKKRYDFKPYFSIGIVWNPMDSMKTEIIDEYGTLKIH